MTDIDGVVERLRAHYWTFDDPLADDAADLLIAMKAENDKYAKAHVQLQASLDAARAEIERLREALEIVRAAIIEKAPGTLAWGGAIETAVDRIDNALTHQGE